MGSEDLGIEASLLKTADEWVKIPQFGQIASLNVSVAAGILIYEAVRQRK
jgi:23S rRNA (guanosine2251-2'-O)-methyltransferase